jgi:hypothetical protein
MKKFLLVIIIGLVLAALAAIGAPQPLASSAAAASAECDCSKLKDLQLELRNAMKLQQAFTRQIAELRAMNRESAAMAFANFAKSAATTVTRPATDKGPSAIDYISRGDGISPDDNGKVTGEGLCLKSDNAKLALTDLDSGASCAGIAKAVHAHEDYHQNECTRLTYMVYREKHPADRAAEEAAAYGVQIALLRAEIARVLEKNCQPCNGQWQGTISYTVVRNVDSYRPKPTGNDGWTTSDGGYDKSKETKTWSGTVVVDGDNGMADSSFDYKLITEMKNHGTVGCCPTAAACGRSQTGRIGWFHQESLTRYASGNGQGKVSVHVRLEKDGYNIETYGAPMSVTSEENTQSSGKLCIGNHPGSPPPTSDSQSHTYVGEAIDLPTGKGKYGSDPNKLSDSYTLRSSSGDTVTTITWNLRRCN